MVSGGGGWVRIETDHKCTNICTRTLRKRGSRGLISLSKYLLDECVAFWVFSVEFRRQSNFRQELASFYYVNSLTLLSHDQRSFH